MSQKLSKLSLGILVFFLSVLQQLAESSDSSAIAQQIIPDETLGLERSKVQSIEPQNDLITGGATRGKNLFHSFEKFSILDKGKAQFSNDLNIQNIIVRITGNSVSSIDGLISAKGTANLLLINPNGIIFGSNASLDIGGSFLASTASRLNFADGSWFSVENSQANPLLKMSIPTGLQFGSNPGAITNRSQGYSNQAINYYKLPGGLKVQPGKTLALVGGDVLHEGGSLTAPGGRIELGSVSSDSLVNLNQITKGWALSYANISEFKNIQLTSLEVSKESSLLSYIDTSGPVGGEIQLRGNNIKVIDSPLIAVTTGEIDLENLAENGQSEGINAIASNLIELSGIGTNLTTLTESYGNGGNITINTKQLNILNGAQVFTSTSGGGSAGNLDINASSSVTLIGSSLLEEFNTYVPSILSSATVADGKAGNLTINTNRLSILDGASISSESAQRLDPITELAIPATGQGGSLIINAFQVELSGTRPDGNPSNLLAGTRGSGKAGNIIVNTDRFVVRDNAEVAVSSSGTGDAGNLEINADSISLNNRGKLRATSIFGTGGGNITLGGLESLTLRSESVISTDARGEGNGGNITIRTNLLTALGNSKITANAEGTGKGGNVRIKTQGLFLSPNSEISATSERGVDGVVEIDRLENDPEGALLTLPAEPVNISGLIAQGCSSGGGSMARGSKFVVTGRGGLPPTPKEAFRGDIALADLGKPVEIETTQAKVVALTNQKLPESTPLVEAQGWVIGSKGEVILTASAPNVTPSVPWMKSNSCHG